MSSEIPHQTPARDLLKLLSGFRATQVIYVAAQLGLADCLIDGPKTVRELAKAVDANPRSLATLMQALVTLGILFEKEEGLFAITPLGMPLQSGDADSIRATALSWGDETSWRPWGDLLFSVKTGNSAFHRIFGVHPFDYRSKMEIYDSILGEAMAGGAAHIAIDLLEGYDFSGMSKVVDVGGGYGTLAAAILQKHPSLRAVVFDRPSVADGARQFLKTQSLAERCEVVSGSFFETIPEGADGYILCRVMHDWDDDNATIILNNCRRAMGKDGRLVVVEGVVRHAGEASPQTLSDVNMMICGGRERTVPEFELLFKAAGFSLAKVTPTNSGRSVIEGIPV